MRAGLLTLVWAVFAGCSVPSLTDLATSRPFVCDAGADVCLPDYRCIENTCQPVSGAPCDHAGLLVDCGRTLGECEQGKIECDGRRFGSCLGGKTPRGEVCGTAKDEDCDGRVDEESPDGGPCP